MKNGIQKGELKLFVAGDKVGKSYLSRRSFLASFPSFGVIGFQAEAEPLSRGNQVLAFEKLVELLQKNQTWWEAPAFKEKEDMSKTVAGLAIASGFDAILHNTLVKFDYTTGVAKKVVTIYRKEITCINGASIGEITYQSLDDAISDIYGFNKL